MGVTASNFMGVGRPELPLCHVFGDDKGVRLPERGACVACDQWKGENGKEITVDLQDLLPIDIGAFFDVQSGI
jgi:hypothetical protein